MMSAKWINPNEFEEELRRVGWMASVSTDKDDPDKYINVALHCIKSGHYTPSRTMRFIFEIECSRAVGNEFVRHEVGVIKVQQSQRYVDASAADFFTPPQMKNNWRYDTAICDSFANYSEYIDEGYKKEIARYALTNATMTKLRVCFNLEGLINFLQKRLCARAQPEMQQLAKDIWQELQSIPEKYKPIFNLLFARKCDSVGYCVEVQCCGFKPTREKFMATYERGRFIEEGNK